MKISVIALQHGGIASGVDKKQRNYATFTLHFSYCKTFYVGLRLKDANI